MQKIPTIFERDGRFVTDTRHPDCGWVFDGEGRATEKLDGTNLRLTVRNRWVVRVEKRHNPSRAQKSEGIVDPWYQDAERADLGDQWIFAAVSGTTLVMWDWAVVLFYRGDW